MTTDTRASAGAAAPMGMKLPEGSSVQRSFEVVGNGMVAPTVLVTFPAIKADEGRHAMWDSRDQLAADLAAAPGSLGKAENQA